MKRYFHKELEIVRSHIMLMGEQAVENVSQVTRALIESDMAIADSIIDGDDVIDDMETQIDDEVSRYVNLRAPVARDLRLLLVAVKVGHDLERVGDEAANIASRARKIMKTGQLIGELAAIPRMCEHAIGMLKDSLNCFIQENEEEALSICLRDAKVNQINRDNFKHFIGKMQSDPSNALAYTEMVFISKSFERVADHATNIAEQVYFLLTTKSLKKIIAEEHGQRVS